MSNVLLFCQHLAYTVISTQIVNVFYNLKTFMMEKRIDNGSSHTQTPAHLMQERVSSDLKHFFGFTNQDTQNL